MPPFWAFFSRAGKEDFIALALEDCLPSSSCSFSLSGVPSCQLLAEGFGKELSKGKLSYNSFYLITWQHLMDVFFSSELALPQKQTKDLSRCELLKPKWLQGEVAKGAADNTMTRRPEYAKNVPITFL